MKPQSAATEGRADFGHVRKMIAGQMRPMRGAALAPSTKAHPYNLPLVSVVIVNYNYGSFLEAAVRSVMAQTYPMIECIVVDDKSSDQSVDLVERLQEEFPSLRLLANKRNGGQSLSFVQGLANTSGPYVIFVDADDFLLPTCVETHIIAHLSLRIPVGLTSVDMLQIHNGEAVTTAFGGFARFVRAHKPETVDYLRYFNVGRTPSISEEALRSAVYYVDPKEAGDWPWSPTSGNCFRRDALALIMNNERLESLKLATDCYVLRGVTCLTGCVLIDRPLVGYRLHGQNDFQTVGNLNRIRSYRHERLVCRSNEAMRLLIDHLFEIAPDLIEKLEAPEYFRDALDALDGVYPPITTSRLSYVSRKVIAHRKRLRAAMGTREHNIWIAHKFLPLWLYWLPGIGRALEMALASIVVPVLARFIRREA